MPLQVVAIFENMFSGSDRRAISSCGHDNFTCKRDADIPKVGHFLPHKIEIVKVSGFSLKTSRSFVKKQDYCRVSKYKCAFNTFYL